MLAVLAALLLWHSHPHAGWLTWLVVGLGAALAQVGAELQRRHVALAVTNEQDGVVGVEHHARQAGLLGALQHGRSQGMAR